MTMRWDRPLRSPGGPGPRVERAQAFSVILRPIIVRGIAQLLDFQPYTRQTTVNKLPKGRGFRNHPLDRWITLLKTRDRVSRTEDNLGYSRICL
jgi:hypothetical protein